MLQEADAKMELGVRKLTVIPRRERRRREQDGIGRGSDRNADLKKARPAQRGALEQRCLGDKSGLGQGRPEPRQNPCGPQSLAGGYLGRKWPQLSSAAQRDPEGGW